MKDIQLPAQHKLLPINTKYAVMPEKVAESSSLKRRREYEESSPRTRSSSFPRPITSCSKHISPLPTKKRISNDTLTNIRKSRFANDASARKITKKDLDDNVKLTKDKNPSLHEKNSIDSSVNLSMSTKTAQLSGEPQDIDVTSEKHVEPCLEMELTKAAIVKEPNDVTVFKGSKVVLRVTYRGCPEPKVKWLRVVSSFFSLVTRS